MNKLYVCDQKKECSKSKGCIKNGGECYLTKDVKHKK